VSKLLHNPIYLMTYLSNRKKKAIKITKKPKNRFVQTNHAHKFLNVGEYTVYNRFRETKDIYIKVDGEFFPVQDSTVSVVDFDKLKKGTHIVQPDVSGQVCEFCLGTYRVQNNEVCERCRKICGG